MRAPAADEKSALGMFRTGFYNRLPHGAEDMRTDAGGIGVSHICELAFKKGVKIYLSGAGPDEIMSDYDLARGGATTTFGGKFPRDLARVYPWPNMYDYAMHNYLRKEDYHMGAQQGGAQYKRVLEYLSRFGIS